MTLKHRYGLYNYRLISTRHGSDKYGPCEVCGKRCDTVYHQIETRDFRFDEVDRQVAEKLGGTLPEIGQSHHECVSLFGHEECLVRKRRLPKGWSESAPGRMMTNTDPVSGGIIDCEDISGEWFVIFSRDDLPVLDGFASREEAFLAHQEAIRKAAD